MTRPALIPTDARSTLPCSVPGCGSEKRAGHLMCPSCWSLLPLRLRSRERFFWNQVINDQISAGERDEARAGWKGAAQDAISYVLWNAPANAPNGGQPAA